MAVTGITTADRDPVEIPAPSERLWTGDINSIYVVYFQFDMGYTSTGFELHFSPDDSAGESKVIRTIGVRLGHLLTFSVELKTIAC